MTSSALAIIDDGPKPIPVSARSVAVIVCGSLQDAVLALAPLKTIRAYHADATIMVLTQPQHARLFKLCPWVDQVETRWQPNRLFEKLSARWGLLTSKIDVIYDFANTEATSALLRRFWPRRPFWSGTAEGCSHPHTDRGKSSLHPLDRHAEQLCLAGLGPAEGYPIGGAPLSDIDWIMPVDGERQADAQGIMGHFGLILPEAPQGLAAVQWPVPRYVELAQGLVRRGLRPVIAGGPKAVPLAAAIRKAAPDALDLTARLDVVQFLQLSREATLAVGGESDMTTLAATAGAPTVSLINASVRLVAQVSPRGPRTVTLVSRNFAEIPVQTIMNAARSVQEPELLQVLAS
jgi:ADP-heptose:LPS heptosyltransferase